ncbi:hypothetical protein PENSPDRAFT_656731 [Peniophora sp. CONT]|nr:hypothetical protein PENSPDRAFT_656731 [Peniophora sp. CONT]
MGGDDLMVRARIERHVVLAPSSGVFDLSRSVSDGGRVGVPDVPAGCVGIDGGPNCGGVLKGVSEMKDCR